LQEQQERPCGAFDRKNAQSLPYFETEKKGARTFSKSYIEEICSLASQVNAQLGQRNSLRALLNAAEAAKIARKK